jgi:hypothetical protein
MGSPDSPLAVPANSAVLAERSLPLPWSEVSAVGSCVFAPTLRCSLRLLWLDVRGVRCALTSPQARKHASAASGRGCGRAGCIRGVGGPLRTPWSQDLGVVGMTGCTDVSKGLSAGRFPPVVCCCAGRAETSPHLRISAKLPLTCGFVCGDALSAGLSISAIGVYLRKILRSCGDALSAGLSISADVFAGRGTVLRSCGDAEMFQPVLGHVPLWCSTWNRFRSPRSVFRQRIT